MLILESLKLEMNVLSIKEGSQVLKALVTAEFREIIYVTLHACRVFLLFKVWATG